MKPVVLCIVDKIGTLNIDGYSKTIISNNDIDYAYLGFGRKVTLPESIIKEEIKNANFECNINLLNAVDYAKNNKSKVHFIGDINKDNGNLKTLLNVCKKLGIKKNYVHLFSSKKPNVSELKKKINNGLLCNVIDSNLLVNDINRVVDVLTKNSENNISKNDLIILFNNDIGFLDSLLNKLKNIKILTMLPYLDTYMFDYPSSNTLGELISKAGLSQLRCNINNYAFDGYKKVIYEKEDIKTSSLLKIDISKYDFVIAKCEEDIKKLKEHVDSKSGVLIIIGKQNNKLCLMAPKKLSIKDGCITNICATVLSLLKVKKYSKMEKSLIGANKEACGFAFRVVSLIFILFCVTYYMARFLHFYLISR